MDNGGTALTTTQAVPVQFTALPHGYPLLGLAMVPLSNWLLPSVGSYAIELAVNGEPLGRVPLIIHQKHGKVSQPEIGDTAAVRLSWAHYVMDFRSVPKTAWYADAWRDFRVCSSSHGPKP